MPTELERTALYWANGIATMLSLIGEIIMIRAYHQSRGAQKFSKTLVISLVYADFCYSISNVLTFFNSNPTICTIEGFVRTASIISVALWGAIISFVSYKVIVKQDMNISKRYSRFLYLNIGVSLLPSLITMISQITGGIVYFGSVHISCTIQPYFYEGVVVTLPIIVLNIFVLFLTCGVLSYAKKRKGNALAFNYNIFAYPLILLCLWTPAYIFWTYRRLTNSAPFILIMIQVITKRLQGFVNFLYYKKHQLSKERNKLLNISLQDPLVRQESLRTLQ